MPGTTSKERHIDTAQGIINRNDQETVTRKEKPRQGQGRILGQGNLVGGTIQFHKTGPTNEPLGKKRKREGLVSPDR